MQEKMKKKKLDIGFIYLDLSTCERCQTTDKVLDESLDELSGELKNLNEVSINKIKITTDKEVKKYYFITYVVRFIN